MGKYWASRPTARMAILVTFIHCFCSQNVVPGSILTGFLEVIVVNKLIEDEEAAIAGFC